MSGFIKLLANMGMPIPRLADGLFVKLLFLVAGLVLLVKIEMRHLYHSYLLSVCILFKGYHTSHPQTPEQPGE